MRDEELAALRNEAQMTADAIAQHFDEIRALFQATGPARIGLSNEDLIAAIQQKDHPRLREHISALHRAMPPDVEGVWVAGGSLDPLGAWVLLDTTTIDHKIAPGKAMVRGDPFGGNFSPPGVGPPPQDANDTPPYLRTETDVISLPSDQRIDIEIPLLDASGRNRGAVGAEFRMAQLFPVFWRDEPMPGKEVYLLDAKGRLISRMTLVLERGKDLSSSETIRRLIAGAEITDAVDVPLAQGPQLVGHVRVPKLAGVQPGNGLDIGWHTIVVRSAAATYEDVDGTLSQLRFVWLTFAILIVLTSVALGIVADARTRERRVYRDFDAKGLRPT